MPPMPRPRPPHLHKQIDRHGNVVWYVRIGKGPRTRVKGVYGTPEFMSAYHAAVRGEPLPQPSTVRSGTLAWLVARYRETDDWRNLSLATRRQRDNILIKVLETAGKQPYAVITEATVMAGRDRRAGKPAAGRHFVDTMRGLFKWAKAAGHLAVDPAAGVAYPKKRKSQGFPAWTEEDVALYETRWPLGTKEHVWLTVLLYTGLRRGDAARLGRQHVRDGIATIRTEKSQGEVEVTIPLLPPLLAAIEAGPTSDLAFICGERGQRLTKESFGNLFRKACNAAGVRKSAHGVRKIAATVAANNGATEAQLEALFGWRDRRISSVYTQSADRRRLAREAAGKLLNENRTSIPSPGGSVRASGQKII